MNLDTLKHLFSNDEKLVSQFLTIFKVDIPQQLLKLDIAIETKDWESVSIIAHSIKSQVKYLDLTAISATAAAMESCAEKREDLENMPTRFMYLSVPLLEVIEGL